MKPHKHYVRALRLTAIASLAIAAHGTAVASAAVDPAAYDPGLSAGQVQHGAWEELVTGAHPSRAIVHFWVSEHRWRFETRDAATHHLETDGVFDGHQTTYRHPGHGRRSFVQLKGPDVVPLPGYTAPYARELIARKNAQPVANLTVAGIPATTYAVPDAPAALSLTVAQETFAPLVRTLVLQGATQREGMLTTATDKSPAARAALAPNRLKALVSRWKQLASD